MEPQNSHELEERTFEFARRVRDFIKKLPETTANLEDVKRLIRASGAVGSFYLGANEALNKKEFVRGVKLARKKAKESRYRLRLVDTGGAPELDQEREDLILEAGGLMAVFGEITDFDIRNVRF